jgi:maleate cis-trans isomerase
MQDIGLLYPTPGAGEDDFVRLASRVTPPVRLQVVYFPWPAGMADLAALNTPQTYRALQRLGTDQHLRAVLPAALAGHAGLDAVAFAVTSSSFLQGPAGVQHQLDLLRELSGLPATSTTHGFQQAIGQLALSRVSLASVYHPDTSAEFVDRIREAGATVVDRVDADVGSDRELAGWEADQIVDLVQQVAHPDAQAVLLPETALHTADLADRLDSVAGIPVLTATQVTVWSACRLVGLHRPVAPHAGVLFGPAS